MNRKRCGGARYDVPSHFTYNAQLDETIPPVVDICGFLHYYLCMVEFNDNQTQALIKRLSAFKGVTLAAFLVAFCFGMIAAGLTARVEEYAGMITALLITVGIDVALLIAITVPLVITVKKIDSAVYTAFARAMYENEDMLKGDTEIAFTAAYSEGKLTFSRQHSTKEIIFCLSNIGKAVSAYTAFGTRLTEFLDGYYSVHLNEGYKNITITDEIAGTPETLTIVENGSLYASRGNNNNYFIKRGLIK